MRVEIIKDEESENDYQNICDKIIADLATMRRRIGQRLSIKSIDRFSNGIEIEIEITKLEGPQPLEDWDC